MNELDFFGISYDEEDIIDYDKVIAVLNKEKNKVLRQRILTLIALDEYNEVDRLVEIYQRGLYFKPNMTKEACADRLRLQIGC